MRKILLLIVLFSINQSFGQESEIDKLMRTGNEAYQKSDFENAKFKYESILKIDSNHKNALFNLAGVELNLGNIEQACPLLQKCYSLGDLESYDLIEKYCNGLEYTEKMFVFHVDELPKFKYKNHFEPLIVNHKQINPKYTKLLRSEIRKSKQLRRIKGKVYLFFNVSIDGELITDIKGDLTQSEKNELTEALRKMTEYQAAVFQGKNVGLFGRGFSLPIYL